MVRQVLGAIALAALPLAFAGCQEAESSADSAPQEEAALVVGSDHSAAQVVEVSARDYLFESPAEIDAGWTTFRFANQGPEPHHLTLVRLEGGHTVADVVAALRDKQPLKGIATAVGGPNAPMPGAGSDATLDLAPGEYALICLIPSPDGIPHVFKGMVKPITVREAAEAGAEPAVDAQVELQDFAFVVSGDLGAGRRTIRTTNATTSTEPHEVVLARLAPGKTAEDLNDWIHAMEGPPPAEFLGGITALDPGHSGSFTADLTPGEYALLCPMPSADGQAHSYKGMMHQFTVQ